MYGGGGSLSGDARLSWFTGAFRSRLIAFVRRARPNTPSADIEDALHDVVLRIHEKLVTSAPPAAPCDWERYMYKAVSHRLNDFSHLARRHTTLDEQQWTEQAAQDADQPEVSAESAERAALFHALIRTIRGGGTSNANDSLERAFAAVQRELGARLQDRHWIVLRMRGLEGLGFQSIAKAMGVSLGSAHGWYREALELCAAVLRRHGVELQPS